MSALKNPFVGLRSFESTDSLYYFGRREETEALLTYLHRNRFVAVVGSSGCGKSSLVRAGLIPDLEAGFLVLDRDVWHIAKMKPGDRPFFNLATSLLEAIGDRGGLTEAVAFAESISTGGIFSVVNWLRPVLGVGNRSLFLLVDQFEEVFRFGLNSRNSAKQEEAALFVDLLMRLVRQDDIPFYICLTMRSDYIGDCDAFHGFPDLMNCSLYLVPRLTREQRREAIEGPIRLAGATIEPQLTDRLLNESGEYRDDLPVLQHALMRTWDRWSKGNYEAKHPIDTVHYEAVHSMKQALSRHADEALEELSPHDQLLAKTLFQLLTETDAENRRLRRSVHLSDIVAVTGASTERVKGIIQKFWTNDRSFLVLSSERFGDNPLVDISHESLMRQWETLGHWMDEEAESADIYRHLADAATLYQRGKVGLYTDPALQLALDWWEDKSPTATWAKRYPGEFDRTTKFLRKSRFVRDEKVREVKRQRQKVIRMVFGFITAAFFVALIIAILAVQKQHESNYYIAKIFEEKAMNVLKSKEETNKYRDAWLYMTAALRQNIDNQKLHLRPSSAGQLLTPGVAYAVFSKENSSLESNSNFSGVTIVNSCPEKKANVSEPVDTFLNRWKKMTLKEIPELTKYSADETCVDFNIQNRKFIAFGTKDGTFRLWSKEPKPKITVLTGHTGVVTGVAFSSDGKTIASGSSDKTIRLWNRESKRAITVLTGHTGVVTSVAFSSDGKYIVSGSSDKTIRLWDWKSKKEIFTLTALTSSVTRVAFTSDGNAIVFNSNDNLIRLWDIEVFNLFLKGGKPTPLFFTFSEGVESFLNVRFEDFDIKENVHPNKFDEKLPPLKNEAITGQSKFNQILQWAKKGLSKLPEFPPELNEE